MKIIKGICDTVLCYRKLQPGYTGLDYAYSPSKEEVSIRLIITL